MKTLLITALLLGAPVAASAQTYEEVADVNTVAATAAAPVLKVDAAVYASQATPAPRVRQVRVAMSPRSITVQIARPANGIVLADGNIGG